MAPDIFECGGIAAQSVLTWLGQHHRDAATAALEKMFFGKLEAEERQRLENLDDADRRIVATNAAEWLLAEGRIAAAGAETAVAALLLGADGPPLSAGERRWLEQLATQPLRLYEVVEATSTGRLVLREATTGSAASIEVLAAEDLPHLSPGTLAGLRIVEIDGRATASGAVYAFTPVLGAAIAEQLREASAHFDAGDADLPRLAGAMIRIAWLVRRSEPQAPPQAESTCACGGHCDEED